MVNEAVKVELTNSTGGQRRFTVADGVAITKADGTNKLNAELASISFQNALNLFPVAGSGWKPQVVTCSARQNTGITELWNIIMDYVGSTRKTGYFDKLRKEQEVAFMHNLISESLNNSFYSDNKIRIMQHELEKQLYEGTITSHKAALKLLDNYFRK